MKNFLLCFVLILFSSAIVDAQSTIAAQSFESAGSDNWSYTETPTFGSFTTPSDTWDIVTTLANVPTMPTDGGSFVGARDLENADNLGGFTNVTFSTVTVTGFSSITISFDYEAFEYDGGDIIDYEVTIDGTPQPLQNLIIGANAGPGTSASGTETINIPNGSTDVSIRILFEQNGASDYAGIDNFKVEGISTVPITLLDFTGLKSLHENNLAWITSTEINNDYFSIQRSSDRINFENIGKVAGSGTTSEEMEYTFTDRSPNAGVNYYRLAQYDFNGDMEYHKVISVENRKKATKIYPSLTQATLNVEVGKGSTLTIYDVRGAVMMNRYMDDDSEISVSELANGVYTLQINTDGVVENHRFVKQ